MIRVRNLVRNFGKLRAVDNVCFDVEHGERFAFLGPNGAGKTTTLKMLTTLLTATSGSIHIDGLDVQRDPGAVRRKLGIVFQDPSLDTDLTAYENMEIQGVLYEVPREVCAKRIERLLSLFDLWDRRRELTKTFSGGMRRRLEIARALLHTPRVLFLDEPTLGLDPQSRRLLWHTVKIMNEGERVTVFLTTHYMDEAQQNADRVAIIDHGAIVAMGRPDELMAQTQTASLEAAFLQLTGAQTRDQRVGSAERMLDFARAWEARSGKAR
jgi:ABC-2 type transport system ATP-binding protein